MIFKGKNSRSKRFFNRLCCACLVLLMLGDSFPSAIAGASTPQPSETVDSQSPAPESTPTQQVPASSPALAEDGATPTEGEEGIATAVPKPTCILEGCTHVQEDEKGQLTALCPLGEWMLAHPQEEIASPLAVPASTETMMIAPMSITVPTAIVLPADGTYTLYRSGTYQLSGGGAQSKLEISANCVVALELSSLQLKELSLGGDAAAEMKFSGASTVGLLTLAGGASLELIGAGVLTVNNANSSGSISAKGGSVQLPFATASNGRVCFEFDAAGTSSATVNGSAYAYAGPHGDGKAYLWLAPLEAPESYRATVNGTVLEVTSQAPEPDPLEVEDFDLSGTDPFSATADTTYNIKRSNPASTTTHTLQVNAGGVTLQLSGLSAADVADIAMASAGTLYIKGSNALKGLSGAGQVNITGAGTLFVATLGGLSASVASGIGVCYQNGSPFAGWTQLPAVGAPLPKGLTAALDGHAIALCYKFESDEAYVPSPAPAGSAYQAKLNGTQLEIVTAPTDGNQLVLGNNPITIDQAGTYYITSQAGASGSIIVKQNVNAKLVITDLRTTGALLLEEGSTVNLMLQGSSVLGNGLSMGDGSKLEVGGTGALNTKHITKTGGLVTTTINSSANLTLPGPGTIAGNSATPTLVFITGPDDKGLKNQQVTLKVSGRKAQTITTDSNGYVYLWYRSLPPSDISVTVLSDANTYATVIPSASSQGNADALPTITNVSAPGSDLIIYTTNGQTSGVQYYVNPAAGTQMPDTYVAGAQRVLLANGECIIPGLKAGDVVVFRVFAAKEANAVLAAETVDGFQFSAQYSFTVSSPRTAFSLTPQRKEYDKKSFVFATGKIPNEATVEWHGPKGKLAGAPIKVGTYTAKVTIPSNHPQYLPGTTDVSVTIDKIVVWIMGEFDFKLEGEEDPDEFFFTFRGTKWGDQVTGILTRKSGEAPGNYPYLTDKLKATEYYELKMDPDSPMFYIHNEMDYYAPGRPHGPYDPLAKIDLVHDIIVFSDGKKLDVVTSTIEKLNISGVHYGSIVTNAEDGQPRPFTPSLRLRPGYNAALLILQAEPELNKDGGYETDLDGNPIIKGRKLTLSYSTLLRLKNQRITHVAFGLGDTYCFLELAELQSSAVEALVERENFSRLGARYVVTLEPITSDALVPQEAASALDAARLGQPLSNLRVELEGREHTLEISPLLRSSKVMFDVSTLLREAEETKAPAENSDITETVIGKRGVPQEEPQPEAPVLPEATTGGALTPEAMELARIAVQEQLDRLHFGLQYFTATATALDSKLIVPYTSSEAEEAIYPAILHTRPYLSAPLAKNGLYGLSAIR